MSSPLDRLRAMCLALPEVTEKISHGEPTWFVRKTFVMYADHHHDDRLAFWCAAPSGAQEELVASEPERFFRPPYVGGRGWLGVWLDVSVDWDEIAEIVTDAYREVAPKKLIAVLERHEHRGRGWCSPTSGQRDCAQPGSR
ncbi:MAG: MmcQ/YjbR family DNA-binding protein [Pseudonocardia sp.]